MERLTAPIIQLTRSQASTESADSHTAMSFSMHSRPHGQNGCDASQDVCRQPPARISDCTVTSSRSAVAGRPAPRLLSMSREFNEFSQPRRVRYTINSTRSRTAPTSAQASRATGYGAV